jgi:signal peptidase II
MRIVIRLALLIVISGATVGCDRVTKHVATTMLADGPTYSFLADTVRLTYTENAGGFLGIGTALPSEMRMALFTIAPALILLALTVFVIHSGLTLWKTMGLALFIAGGASNLLDRLLYGSVVDFLNVGVGWLRTGIFNVADAALMLGAGIFLLAEFKRRRPPRNRAEGAGSE